MIDAADFIDCANRFGYRYFAGVPCSFLTPFIDYTIAHHSVYVSSANEGDALATGAGAVLGGQRAVVMMQNSGLGNAVNPLTSLAHVFRIPVLLIVTLRGDPELDDEPQHELMGRVTGDLFDIMTIPWEYFPSRASQIEPIMQRAEAYMARECRPYGLIVRKGVIVADTPEAERKSAAAPFPRLGSTKSLVSALAPRLSRAEVLGRIVELTPENNTVVVATTGHTGRELYSLADRPNHLYMVGSMGCASSLGLGLAMARPDLGVVVIDGDGAALMRMGNFATLGAYGSGNLVHILLDNEAHDSTGGQATVSSGVSFARIAEACGYPVALEGDDLAVVDAVLRGSDKKGPRFAHLKIRPVSRKGLPRPSLSPPEVRARLMTHIGAPLSFARNAADLERDPFKSGAG